MNRKGIDMRRIPLTQGQFALVDDDDYEELNRFKWCAQWSPHTRSFYAVRSVRLLNGKRTTEQMHRRILGLEYGDKREVDHIGHVTLDNRRAHIRIVSQSENQHNHQRRGYYWHAGNQKYIAEITVDGDKKYLGLFATPQEARAAYLVAKPIYHPTAPLVTP